jgi:hypothetical protein
LFSAFISPQEDLEIMKFEHCHDGRGNFHLLNLTSVIKFIWTYRPINVVTRYVYSCWSVGTEINIKSLAMTTYTFHSLYPVLARNLKFSSSINSANDTAMEVNLSRAQRLLIIIVVFE